MAVFFIFIVPQYKNIASFVFSILNSMKSQTDTFYKSIKFFGITVLLMFAGPGAIYEAFKNQEHPLYIPVLVVGFIFSIGAVIMLFRSLKLMMRAIFNDK